MYQTKKALGIEDILENITSVRILLAGPCGIGKSTLGSKIALAKGIDHLDLDEIKNSLTGEQNYWCGVGKLNLDKCLPFVLDNRNDGFVLDFGGDNVFRPNADNDERLLQMKRAKIKYGFEIVVLMADEEVAFKRFMSCKERTPDSFPYVWEGWILVGEPYWLKCADYIFDTTNLVIGEP